MTNEPGRSWGYWTRAKLEILSDYLAAFTTASKGQSERIYLDAFAGEGAGLDRLTGEEFPGSARIALEAGGDAGFTRFRYFEKGQRAAELDQRLRADYPSRDIKVYEGDVNDTVHEALRDLYELRWAPTFAFLDPDGMELAWETLAAFADHKRGYRAPTSTKPEYKVELWMLFPTSGIVRTLALDEAKANEADFARATRLLGSEAWQPIYELRRDEKLSAAEAREEYVNLMRWRLEQVLKYRFTHPFELKNTKGSPLYHMILATDSDAGTKIMESIYTKAASRLPAMLKEARDRLSGQQTLELGLEEPKDSELSYRYEPPWEPRF